MNRKTRNELANRIAKIVTDTGGTVEVEHRSRSSYIGVTFDTIKCGFDLDNLHAGGILASWHSSKHPLKPMSELGSANTYHRTKATLYRDNAEDFIIAFEDACIAVADGDCFIDFSEVL